MNIVYHICKSMRGTIALSALCLASSLQAQSIIYDNGGAITTTGHPPDSAAFSDPGAFNTGRVVADDFALTSCQGTITGVRWTGLYDFSNTPNQPDMFTLKIYSPDPNNGLPGSLFASLVVNNLVRTAVGPFGATTLYSYTASVSAVTLPSTRFWLAIVNDTTADTDDNWAWTGQNAFGNAVIQHDADDPSLTWHQSTFRMDFVLTGPPTCLCLGDVNGDCVRDGKDIAGFARCLTNTALPTDHCSCADMDQSGVVDLADKSPFVTLISSNPPPPPC